MIDYVEIKIELGKIPSLNKFYSSPHWTFRSKEKTKWKSEIMSQLDYDFKMKSCSIIARVNYRYDLDNCIMAIKFTQDAIVDAGLLEDDNKRYIKKLSIIPDPELPKDSSLIIIKGEIINK